MFQRLRRSIVICTLLLAQSQLFAAAADTGHFHVTPGTFDLNKYFAPKTYTPEQKKQAVKLFSAIETGNIRSASLALKAGAPVDIVDTQGRTALLAAAQKDDLRMGRFLLKQKADPNIPISTNQLCPQIGLYPLHAAIINKNLAFLNLLLEHDADPCAFRTLQVTPLQLAFESGDQPIFQRLLTTRCRAMINNLSTNGVHLLSHASYQQTSLGMAAALINAGANVNARDAHGRSPLHYAADAGNALAAQMLLRSGANVMAAQQHPNLRIHIATKSSNNDIVQQIQALFPMYPLPAEDRTPLHFACQRANPSMINLLLDHGAQESSALFSITPLALLMEHAKNEALVLSVLDKLLAVGKPNMRMTTSVINGIDYQTPLATALCKGYVSVVQKLLAWFKEHREVINNYGTAYINGFCNLCEYNKSNPHAVDDTQLQAILDDMLALGADPSKYDSNQCSAFHKIPIFNLNPQFLKTIALKYPYGLFQENRNGTAPVHVIKLLQRTGYKSIIAMARAAFISHRVEQQSTTFEDEDGLIQEYDENIGDVSRLLEYKAVFEGVLGYDRLKNDILQHGAIGRLVEKTQLSRDGHVGQARGARFELETAFALLCAGKKIVQFGAKYDGKEFDIETPKTLVECKDINWAKQTSKLATFLLEHKVIAERHQKKFKFYSRRPIPDKWQQWLRANSIKFKDTLDVTSRNENQEYEQAIKRSPAPSSSATSSSRDA